MARRRPALHSRLEQESNGSPVGLLPYLRSGLGRTALTVPLIYSLLLPLALLDLWATLYQWTCFPVYGIGRVRRRDYLILDRHRLPYLNALEKLNCGFCAYATGVLGYVREIAGRTEAYWCPITHARPVRDTHAHYRDFFDYGDAAGYRHGLMPLRRGLGRQRPGSR